MEVLWSTIFFLILLVHGTTEQTDDFYEQGDPEVSFEFKNGAYLLNMNETNEETTIVLFKAKGKIAPDEVNTVLNFTINDVDPGVEFSVTGSFDYEMLPNYEIKIFVEGLAIFSLSLNNLNDEPPSLLMSTCTMMENDEITAEISSCEYTISDDDGNLQDITFDFNGNGEYFKLEFRETPAPTDKDSKIYLITGDSPLDYEKVQNIQLKIMPDDGINTTSAAGVVLVGDQNDNPPKWITYSTNERFPEQSEFSFTVIAIDGDYGINNKITYDIKDNEESVTIDPETGDVTVPALDRDEKNLNEFSVTLIACEETTDNVNCTDLVINFYVDDINDNPPIIACNEATGKIANLSIEENSYEPILSITVTDSDTASNAQFKVELKDTNTDVKYSEAFQITPSIGYEEQAFDLLIRKPENLDYENEKWRTITFDIEAFDPNNETLKDTLTININVEDIYDEPPKFTGPLEASVKETIKNGELVIKITATPGDANDEINYAVNTELLKCDETEKNVCNLQIAVDNAFDYSKTKELTVQITATGKSNKLAQTSLKITIDDVNNKPPVIETGSLITINENIPLDDIVNASIKASDEDSTASLTVNIDWDNSYATKNSVKLKNPEDYKVLELYIEDNPNTDNLKVINFKITKAVDFEIFDTLVLKIEVTDENTDPEEETAKMSSVLISISIIDENDNEPEFSEINFNVRDGFGTGQLIETILFHDKDISDDLTLDCSPKDEKFDWIDVSTDGKMTVSDRAPNKQIDCDADQIPSLIYTCTIHDGVHNVPKDITITIQDINDNPPKLTISDQNINENSDPNTEVVKLDVVDNDRDEKFHTVQCQFINSENCANDFQIDNSNRLLVKGNINREDYKDYNCIIKCIDNPQGSTSDQLDSGEQSFIITINDVNDITPQIVAIDFEISETQTKQPATIGTISAEDDDEGDHANLVFTIATVSVTDTDIERTDEELLKLFELLPDATNKSCTLVSTEDMKNYYGKYTLNIMVEDCASCNEDETKLNSSANILLDVKRHIYDEPYFSYPNEDDDVAFLNTFQNPNGPLDLFNNSETLPNIVFSDVKEGTCSKKWTIKIDITNVEPKTNIFSLQPVDDQCQRQIIVNENYNQDDVINQKFIMTIQGQLIGDTDNESVSNSADATLTLNFLDKDADPFFDDDSVTFSVEEDNSTVVWNINLAHYPIDDVNQAIHYTLQFEDPSDKSYFEIQDQNLVLTQALDYETKNLFTFSIRCAKDSSGVNKDPKSTIKVVVNVTDINDEPPKFVGKLLSAVMTGYTKGQTVTTLEAQDEDTDVSELIFNIKDCEGIGDGIKDLKDPFVIKDGVISTNFEVDASMNGYFSVKVSITDGVQETIDTLTIFVITPTITVDFRFENDLTTVLNKRNEMMNLVGDILNYTCGQKSIESEAAKAATTTNVTKAVLYFINKNNSPVQGKEIESQVTDLNTFGELRNALLSNLSLVLLNFESKDIVDENMEDVLKAWLIGVSVVLGAVIIVLVIVYFLKTRRLTQRISNLTKPKFGSMDSGLNTMGVRAPNTNIHVAEGSNPAFSVEQPRNENFDRNSIVSEDSSDLIGIEDDPEFDQYI